ncbi:MAG: hypothetical protein R3C26_18860 [Calditrichia bacterium]
MITSRLPGMLPVAWRMVLLAGSPPSLHAAQHHAIRIDPQIEANLVNACSQ